jgi:hypothetical protein
MTDNISTMKPWIVVVGGFLGAGKTTLILAAARELEHLGRRCAVILNDQGSALVDTRLAEFHDLQSGEVTGGCFCCRLSELIDVAERLRAHAPEVIFAEPVGSCADIVATVLRPFHELQNLYRIAPFTVLVDPERAEALRREGSGSHLNFLFSKQIDEADLVCFTKADLRPSSPQIFLSEIANRPVRQLSAATGQGVLPWLDEVLSGTLSSSEQFLDIDYERYAQAEAALAWLNLQAAFEPRVPMSPAIILGPFLESLDQELTRANISIVHLKMIVSSPCGFVKAAICANGQEPQVEGMLDASPSARHDILLNLRALGEPDDVRTIVEHVLTRLDGRLENLELSCFSPAAPQPERRIGRNDLATQH